MAPPPSQGRFHDHGVALIITLLLLFLLSVVGLAAVMSNSSDLMINGYYKNYRGTFYAADSGVNMARQAIFSYFNTNAPATWPATQASATTAGNTLATNAATYVTGLYGNSTSLNTGTAANSVPASFFDYQRVSFPAQCALRNSNERELYPVGVHLQLYLGISGRLPG